MKTCTKCHAQLDESEFYNHPTTVDGLTPWCKTCHRQMASDRRARMTPEQREAQRASAKAYKSKNQDKIKNKIDSRIRERRARINSIRASKTCLRCGENDSTALDFHHVSEKSIDISRHGASMSIKRITSEISKCIVLCSNCHRKLHAGAWSLPDLAERIKSEYPDAYLLLEK